MKKLFIALMAMCTLVLAACGKSNDTEKVIELSSDVYKGFTVEYSHTPDVTDEEVQAEIEELLKDAVGYVNDDKGTVKDGDTINIDFTEIANGKEIGKETDFLYKVGSGSLRDGIDDYIIGSSAGNTISVTVQYPEGYPNEELAGRSGTMEITIKTIVTEAVPTLTDDIARDYFNCEDVEDFTEKVRERLQINVDYQNQIAMRSAAWTMVMKNADSEDDMLIVRSIAKQEGIDYLNVSEDEMQQYAINHGFEFIEDYKENYTEEEINNDILFNRVLVYLEEVLDYKPVD